MARAQPLSTSQSDSAFSHIYPSSSQEAISHDSVSLTTSSTSPNITSPLSPPSLMETSISINSIDAQSTSHFTSDLNGGLNFPDADNTTLIAAHAPEVDPQILKALKSKDRIYVLKLGEIFEALIKERRARAELSPATSYQRLLVHRCSAYYKLVPENDPMTKGFFVLYTADSRIPERRISELVPAESTTQPAFKIMRRSACCRPKPQSQTGSISGEDADLSDLEPSESGSQRGRSNATGGSSKKRMTIEEREAAYNKARSRIFLKFFEDQGKDEDMMTCPSPFSGSASTSTNTDSPATVESERPATSGLRDGKDKGRGNLRNGATPHSRSRASFNSSESSRNSRAPSPSFTNATLFEPPALGSMYDPSQHPHSAGCYPNQTTYSFPGQGPMPLPPFNPVYPYYAPYNTYPHPQYNPSDPQPSSVSEPFSPQLQMNYGYYYGWSNQPPMQSPPHTMHHPPPSLQYPSHLNGPPPPQTSPFETFTPQSQLHSPYLVNGQFPSLPPPGPYLSALPRMNMQQTQQPPYETPRPMNGNTMGHQPDSHPNYGGSSNGLRNGLGNGVISPNSNGRVPVTRSVSPSAVSNGNGVNETKSRLPIPPQARTAWSYGPGVGMGGYVAPNGIILGDAIGPRLNSNYRGPSGIRNPGNSYASSNCDEASSTVSRTYTSTTSSSSSQNHIRYTSSHRTYTSMTSSQHPLPVRPDWAVGLKLKPQPTLASRVHEQQHSLINTSSISSPLPHHNNLTSQSPHQQQPASLQSSDFPPLISAISAQEKRAPVVTGVWGVSRPLLSPTNVNGNTNGVNGSGTAHDSPIPRLDEAEGGAERPVDKQQEQPTSLQSTDFPPLTSAQEKRAPVVTGAWGASRPSLSPTNVNGNMNGVNGSGTVRNSPISRLDEADGGGTERPVGKTGELYNPKSVGQVLVYANNGHNGYSHQRTPE